ncbi:hypothetical protein FQN57_005030 [Myotisia sp. PD_48]|nr:hypothetical protein FQN57_005030 [Myotisia sp. PD_48]
MAYELSISVFGPGTDPSHRSHWGFIINRPGDDFGDLLHTRLLDLQRLWYIFEERSGTNIISQQSEGRIKLSTLTFDQRSYAKLIIQRQPAPMDGKRKCQDWVSETVAILEEKGIVSPGMSERIGSAVGKPAAVVATMMGDAWINTK